jgi:decaprenylphospho-beta-D-ribofuranose 2-oxidase
LSAWQTKAVSINQVELTNWTRSARSACWLYPVSDSAGIARALADARTQGLTVIPHGAGHSYTDAALNSGGVVIDLTPMHQILSWDPAHGIMRVEAGVTMQEMVQTAWKDGWWPSASPSTPAVTLGGCAAMNVNGRNAWKCGPFGVSILSLEVMLASGEGCTLAPEQDTPFFYALLGSLGLLGIVTSLTIQLQRVESGYVTVRRRSAAALDGVFTLFAEEEGSSDFMEAWLDGFAGGDQLGRGILTSAVFRQDGRWAPSPFPAPGLLERLEIPFVHAAARLGRPGLQPAIQMANRVHYQWGQTSGQVRSLVPYTYWPAAVFAGYPGMFPEGAETFQAFVPRENAPEIFKQVLGYSHQQGCIPLWCIIKQHRRDPFLLSYQVDGFSLELNYQRTHQTAPKLQQVLQHMIAAVIEAGGRFYLAKDHFQTHAQYRQSVGDEVVEAFLRLKQRYDPEMRLQSDLFRRLFQP